jgi:hypothetical protein
MTVCVIINDVGGIPHTLHENVTFKNSPWSEASYLGIPIPSTDPADGLKHITHDSLSKSLFSIASVHGVATVFAGPSCENRRYSADEDPERSLSHWGIRSCSPYDDQSLVGFSEIYDEDTLRYAMSKLSETHILMWVNLVALRGVDSVSVKDTPKTHRFVFPHVSDVDDFSKRLHLSMTLIEKHMERVQRFVRDVLERFPDAHIFHTASHSLSLGEHGMRGGHTPMASTCTTFVSSCPPLRDRPVNLEIGIRKFVADAFQIPLPLQAVHAPITLIPSLDMTRSIVSHNEHTYAVLFVRGVLKTVYDLSTDPFELTDISPNITHIRNVLENVVPPYRGQLRESPTPVAHAPPPPPRRKHSSTQRTAVSKNVKLVEQRLNKLHR